MRLEHHEILPDTNDSLIKLTSFAALLSACEWPPFNTATDEALIDRTVASNTISCTNHTCFVSLCLLFGLLWCSLCFAADLASNGLACRGSAAQPQTVPRNATLLPLTVKVVLALAPALAARAEA